MKERLKGWREVIRGRPLLNNVWRLAVFTVGATVLAAGVAMLVLPGPGWAAIFVGFAILATEFAWAQRALTSAKQTASKAKEKALDPRARRRNQLLAICAGLVVAAAIVAYLQAFGLNLPWHV
ncbi:TIGR02611 family protein [Actinoallomurus purpureus]|uniref:TIGR02611 family protein n=1 Tax=Actinoallomurus purpureus TaxID=478114 RepID=UPI002093DEFB|nr:TIGR02611 family protein [Actinoallomurus purpureus]MCO6011656.1 TIGR02611 family protein [Actinoallomurus purpureus]